MAMNVEEFVKLYNERHVYGRVLFRPPNMLEFANGDVIEVPAWLAKYFETMQRTFGFVVEPLSATMVALDDGVLALWASGAEMLRNPEDYMSLYCFEHKCPERHGIDYCCYQSGDKVDCEPDTIDGPCAAAVGAFEYARSRWPSCF